MIRCVLHYGNTVCSSHVDFLVLVEYVLELCVVLVLLYSLSL